MEPFAGSHARSSWRWLLVAAVLLLAGGGLAVTGLVTAKSAIVSRVVDGDTFVLAGGERVRVLGIDTPEKGMPLSEEATELLEQLIEGKAVTLESDRTDKDRYGRSLRYVRVDGALAEERLLRAGLARVLIIPPDRAHEEEFRAWEAEAREAERGIWAFADQTRFCIGVGHYHPNAAGDDRVNKNDEFVAFRNGCGQAVRLEGWVLGDSGRNRFAFPAISIAPHERITVRSGSGVANATDLYWDAAVPVWNNDGDAVLLWNAANVLVLNYTN